jgi:rhodanese-related sulfurtransferase
MKRSTQFVIVFLVVILSACGAISEGYRNVSTEEAKQQIDKDEVVVLDVRTAEEYQQGHIPNAILIPVDELESRLNELDKEETYLVVCRSGNRSAQASEILTSNSFTNIYNMTGGMNNWAYEIEN